LKVLAVTLKVYKKFDTEYKIVQTCYAKW